MELIEQSDRAQIRVGLGNQRENEIIERRALKFECREKISVRITEADRTDHIIHGGVDFQPTGRIFLPHAAADGDFMPQERARARQRAAGALEAARARAGVAPATSRCGSPLVVSSTKRFAGWQARSGRDA